MPRKKKKKEPDKEKTVEKKLSKEEWLQKGEHLCIFWSFLFHLNWFEADFPAVIKVC